MLRKLFPLLLALVGLGGGIGAGLILRPKAETGEHAISEGGEQVSDAPAHGSDPAQEAEATVEDHGAASASDDHGDGSESGPEYVKMNNQFVVPVVKDGRVNAMVVLAISLEVEPGMTDGVYEREPKLRDAFLQVMFDHANVGGFNGSFTDSANLVVLRTNLKEAAAMILGTTVRDVLITDIARQDG